MPNSAVSVRRGAARGVPALVLALSLVLLLPPPPADAAGKRSKSSPAALPTSQLVRDQGLANLLAGLLPSLFAPPAPPAPPPLAPTVVETVKASTVKVSGVACGVRVDGSGFSPAPDTIVTNAHVVAGTTTLQVVRPDGRRLPATVQVFDPDRDLAVLAVPGLGQQPLPLGTAAVGGGGAVFGHPRGQVPVEVSPARVVQRVDALVGNIYDERLVPRRILVLASELEPGDSGGALVDQSGNVVGVAFAVSSWWRNTAFAVAAEELSPVLARPRTGRVGTGPCLI